MTEPQYTHAARDANGNEYEYRMVSATLERRKIFSRYWERVTGEDLLRMTPSELRTVANVLERKP